MDIQILELIEGARRAEGLTVVIDVFRAFTLECWLFSRGAECIYPVGQVEDALALKREDPRRILFGERGGAIIEGFEYGNSPSEAAGLDLRGKTLIHTTSAGTQGIENAVFADEIITGSLVNARAVAAYIRQKAPRKVSLVAMGNAGVRRAGEDVLCAEYIKSLLEDKPLDIQPLADALRYTEGGKFFDPDQTAFPWKTSPSAYPATASPFVIRLERDPQGRKILRLLSGPFPVQEKGPGTLVSRFPEPMPVQ